MRIGIDLDNTIAKTTELFHNKIGEYAKMKKIDPLIVMNDELIKEDFLNNYLIDIYENVEVIKDAPKVIKRLKNNEIEVDDIITKVYGKTKVKACKDNNIDLMIDDNPYNYKILTSEGIKCILFDDQEKYNLEENYITSWIDIEKYIERNR